MRKKNGFICSRCGGMVESVKPVKIIFFISDNGDLTDEGLPENMAKSIEENYCGVCAVKIRQAMDPVTEIKIPTLRSLEPGYRKNTQPEEKQRKGGRISVEQVTENLRRISEMYREGRSFEEIAEEIGVNRKTVVKHVHDLIEGGDLEKRKEKKEPKPQEREKARRLTPEEKKQIYEMYRNGETYDAIARVMGVSNTAIGYHINRLNWKRTKSGP